MDLIYTDKQNNDLGVLMDYEIDLAYGESENDFSLKMPLVAHCLDAGYTLYIEGTEYGGIVDSINVNTAGKEVTYKGRTWHGIMDSKIVTPDAGEDYYVVSGDANDIIDELLTRCTLTSRFEAFSTASGINIPSTNLPRYKGLYTTLLKLLSDNGAKLDLSVSNGIVTLKAVEVVDYTDQREFTDDEISFTIEKGYNPVNHLICLGQGNLKDRQRVDLFADEDGNISQTQTLFGMDEVADTYDYSSVESIDELVSEGTKELKERRKDGTIDVDFNSMDNFDIGDKIGALENVTGIYVEKHISKKIVKIKKSQITINYEIKS